jgi:hypothetical protein
MAQPAKNYDLRQKGNTSKEWQKKKIKGYEYYYIVLREDGDVKFIYKGKSVPQDLINEYSRAKDLRRKYRSALSQVKKQIKFLKGSLRGKESI